MKIGTTILALPNQLLTDEISSQLDIVEWTTGKIHYGYLPQHGIVQSSLSVADMRLSPRGNSRVNFVQDTDIALALVTEGFMRAVENGLTSWSFGSPTLRQVLNDDVEDSILVLKAIKNCLEAALREMGKESYPFKIYIEPLPHKKGTWSNPMKIKAACDEVNDSISNITFKPMLDIGTLSRQIYRQRKEDIEATMHACEMGYIERIHLCLTDTFQPLDGRGNSRNALKHLKSCLARMSSTKDLTIIYEHINVDNNESYKRFIAEMRSIEHE